MHYILLWYQLMAVSHRAIRSLRQRLENAPGFEHGLILRDAEEAILASVSGRALENRHNFFHIVTVKKQRGISNGRPSTDDVTG
jgi:hypothetical protein